MITQLDALFLFVDTQAELDSVQSKLTRVEERHKEDTDKYEHKMAELEKQIADEKEKLLEQVGVKI